MHFDGGLNSKFERTIIEDNESPDCLNVVFSNGAVETRDGSTKLNTAAIGSFVGDGIYTRRDDTGAETMIVFAGGTAWQLGGTSFTTIGSAQSVFTAGIRVAAAQYEGNLFIGNGGVIPYKYNGAHFTRHGVYPPTGTAVAASNAAGSLTGDYRYVYTNVNSNLVESDYSPVMGTFTAAAATIRVTGIGVAPTSWGVNARRLYRTVAGGSTYKRVTEIADNTTTQYDDTTADSALGVAAPDDNGVPPLYSVVCYHQNRIFCNDPTNMNYVYYSDLGEPYTFGALNFVKVGDNSSDLVKTLSVYDNHILVNCERSQWLIFMPSTDPTEWQLIRLKSEFGSKSPFCAIEYNNKQLIPVVQNDKFVGFAALSGNAIEATAALLTTNTAGSLLKSDRIEPDMYNVVSSYISNISGISYKNKAWIALTYGSGNTTNNRIYQMDFSMSNMSKNQKESWVPFTGLNAAQFTIYNGQLYYVSSTATGFVYQLEAGVDSDDGAAINSYFYTKEFSGYKEHFNLQKDFRFANLLIEKPGSYQMTVGWRTDSDDGVGDSDVIDLAPGGSLWGTMVWGTDVWGGSRSQEDYVLDLGTTSGKRIQFFFTNQNTAGQRFKVHGMNFLYNVRGRR